MNRFNFIFLDLDGTIFDFKASQKNCVKKTAVHFGFSVDDSQVERYSQINDSCWKEFELGHITSAQLRLKRFKLFFQEYGIGHILPVDFNEIYLKHLGQDCILYEGALEFVKALKSKGYKTAVITNGIKENQYSRVAKSGISPFIDAMVVSEEAGAPKPDEQIFFLAQERLGIESKEGGVIIGDSLSADIAGGIRYKIATIWYNPQKLQNDKGITPTFEATSYSEILNII